MHIHFHNLVVIVQIHTEQGFVTHTVKNRGIVHQDIDTAELLPCDTGSGGCVVLGRYIGFHKNCRVSCLANLVRHLLTRLFIEFSNDY